ncbi:hypothetical protein Pcinc_025815 [Petrolisthes cinctipes]|uniref:Uncharacterized protein n=1 Tax=Petrolisthes cinctipes TaxID=88211 RepID=A0AAE1KB91_PETCI|nr:hypothetical protein Pcinc_025815 [Petrolisthes cinctipes]
MDILEKFVNAGQEMGLEGSAPQAFMMDQQAFAREERQRDRERREFEVSQAEKELENAIRLKENELELEKQRAGENDRHREHELHMNIIRDKKSEVSSGDSSGYVARPKLPKFEESVDDIDAHLERFKRFATSVKWLKDEWAINLSSLLTGKALQAYIYLTPDAAQNYDTIRKTILERHTFRDTLPVKGETITQFSSRMTRYFDRRPQFVEAIPTGPADEETSGLFPL